MKKIQFFLWTIFLLSTSMVVKAQVAPVIISEVFYDTPLDERTKKFESNKDGKLPSHNGEYIELFNTTQSSVDISGWLVKDRESKISYKFPNGTRIPARSTILLVYRDPITPSFTIRSLFPEITTTQEKNYVFYHNCFKLTNDGDIITLSNNKGKLIDRMSFKSKTFSNSAQATFWDLKAVNGHGTINRNKLLSINRNDVHFGVGEIYPLESDYEVGVANPLKINSHIDLPVLDIFYDDIDTSLAVGGTYGEGSVSPTGAAVYEIPIDVPVGVNGLQPHISIAYNSQGGSFILGKGWDISGISEISRGTQNNYIDNKKNINSKIIEFNDQDELYIDGKRLILLSGTHFKSGAVYGTEVEDYSRVVISTYLNEIFFELITKEGMKYEYGKFKESRFSQTINGKVQTLTWKLNKITDPYGNSINYGYSLDGQYLTRIYSTEVNNSMEFQYKDNTHSPRTSYINGFKVDNKRVLDNIKVYSDGRLFKKYEFSYSYKDIELKLQAITEYAGERSEYKLNSTKIEWGESDNIIQYEKKYPGKGIGIGYKYEFFNVGSTQILNADLNGDGRTDKIIYRRDNKMNYIFAHLFNPKITNNQFGTSPTFTILGSSSSKYPFQIHAGDIDGDGKDEVIYVHEGKLKTYSYPSGQEKDYSVKDHVEFFEDRAYTVIVNDFNNDGINDVIIFFEPYKQNNRSLKAQAVYYRATQSSGLFFESTITYDNEISKNFQYSSTPVIGNFIGNGKVDILLFASNQERPPKYLSLEDLKNPHINIGYDRNMSAADKTFMMKDLYLGDFNGDGLTDFIYRKVGTKEWILRTYHGGSFFNYTEKVLPFPKAESLIGAPQDDVHKIWVVDYNGDGLPDVILGDNVYKKNGSKFDYQHTNWYFYTNTGTAFKMQYQTKEKSHLKVSHLGMVADINGDGVQDLMIPTNIPTSSNQIPSGLDYFNMPNPIKRNLVHKITNGMGQTYTFTYKNVNDFEPYKVDYGQVKDMKVPLVVVDTYTDVTGNTFTYNFQKPKLHIHKGFLGFTSVEIKDEYNKTTVKRDFEVETQYFNLFPKTETVTVEGTPVSETQYVYNIQGVSGVRHIPLLKTLTTHDKLKNTKQVVTYAYNTNGTLHKHTTNIGDGLQINEVSYSNYVKRGGNSIVDITYLPRLVRQKSTRKNQTAYDTYTYYTYNTNGDVIREISDYLTERAETMDYVYYPQGLVKTSSVTPPGGKKLTTTYKYDDTFRFLVETINPLGYVSKYVYDSYSGNLTESIDYKNFSTKYTYDAWGNLLKAVMPNTDEIQYTTSWGTGFDYLYKKEVHKTKTYSKVITYYDRRNREIKTEKHADGDTKNAILTSYNEYNNIGQLLKTIHPHFSEDAQLTTTYEYDYLGRITKEIYFDGEVRLNTSYKYSGFETTVTLPDGNTNTSIVDASDLVVERKDKGGSIKYTYNSLGDMLSALYNGITTSLEYDKYGNRTKLKDPDAGTISYYYNNDNTLKSQVNAKGDSTVYEYDDYRRIKNKFIYSGKDILKTTYSYKDSGNGIGEIYNIAQFLNNKSVSGINFLYNSKHQLEESVKYYDTDGLQFRSQFRYNELGAIERYTSPSGLIIHYLYGWHFRRYGSGMEPMNITIVYTPKKTFTWQLQSKNAHGQITREYVEISSRWNFYNYKPNGLLTGNTSGPTAKPTSFLDLEYTYDPITYNLTGKYDHLNNRKEQFEYDAMNRLLSAKVNNRVEYEVSYGIDGNILSKTDVGTYVYENPQPHAISGIKGVAGNGISDEIQRITYNALGKIETVSQDKDHYRIEYGYDEQRIKTVYTNNNKIKLIRYYNDTYEMEIDEAGNITHVDYIYTPAGLTYISKRGAVNDFYLVHTDNLGSIIQILSEQSTQTVSKYAYTPWGGRILLSGENITDRGYTGHEHLTALGLINMNGRVYDPVLARFLSPDPYVQAPEYTQSFNRYSYVWNNPFKYTDPSGEYLHLVFGAIAGGIMNMGYNMKNAENGWQSLGYFAIGAVSGFASAGIGGGVSSAIGGGSFIGGFMGTASAVNSATGFLHGALVGGTTGFSSPFLTNMGNSIFFEKNNFSTAWTSGLIGLGSGFVVGGVIGGIDALSKKREFWDGSKLIREEILPIPSVAQVGETDCTWSIAEANEGYLGGTRKASDFKKIMPGSGVGLDRREHPKMYSLAGYIPEEINLNQPIVGIANDIADRMALNKPVVLNYRTGDNIINAAGNEASVIHATSVNRVRIYDNGKVKIGVMNPQKGSHVKSFVNKKSFYQIFSIYPR